MITKRGEICEYLAHTQSDSWQRHAKPLKTISEFKARKAQQFSRPPEADISIKVGSQDSIPARLGIPAGSSNRLLYICDGQAPRCYR